MTILLTGSKGFIGSHLKPALEKLGHKVVGMDKKNGIFEDLQYSENLENIKIKIDMIVHLAAVSMVRVSVEDPGVGKENFESTFNVLEFARKNNVRKIIFSSSRETYGNLEQKTCKETDSRTWNAESPYAATKSAGEALLSAYKTCYGIEYVTVRLSNVFGADDPNDRFIPRLFEKLPRNELFEVYGRDKQMDFTFIEDCISGLLTTIKNFEKLSCQPIPIYNIAYGKSEKLLDVALYLKELFNSKSEIKVTKNYTGEVVKYTANINKFKKLTGWAPKYSVFEGLKKMYENR